MRLFVIRPIFYFNIILFHKIKAIDDAVDESPPSYEAVTDPNSLPSYFELFENVQQNDNASDRMYVDRDLVFEVSYEPYFNIRSILMKSIVLSIFGLVFLVILVFVFFLLLFLTEIITSRLP